MQVNPKYKQTEVGLIPDEWEFKKIAELIEDGSILGHLDGNHGELYPRSHEFKEYGIPYIGATDFHNGSVDFSECKHLSLERAKQFKKGIAKCGDVLFAHNATVGPVALLITPLEFVILSTTATYFRCNHLKVDNIFLKYALQAQVFVKQYRAVMAQSTRFQVPITAQRKLALTLPPLPEQRAIATALSDVDALINSLDRLIAKKRDIKQASMQQLLTGKARLPGFSGDWENRNLGEIAEITKLAGFEYTNYFNSYRDGGDIIVIRGTNIKNNQLDLSDIKTIPSAVSIKLERSRLCRGDLVFAYVGTIGPISLIEESGKYHLGPNTARITVKKGVSPRFIYSFFTSSYVREEIVNHTSTGAQPSLSMTKIRSFKVSLPGLLEQESIASILWDIDKELSILEQRRDKTLLLKQGMMQELLTGRTRLV